ncbi:MAG: 2-dehydropantoate 2-reductase [Gammaproteobacteria bacterium]|nr:2-dehydropantoate 2-reductase [Gammaproteobacteria bacterium]
MREINRVCVVGAGAIGSLLVGHIGALPDIEMTVLVRRESHARDLNEKGLKVSGKSDLTAEVLASTEPADLGEVDLVIIATKTTAVEASVTKFKGHFPNATVMMIQNGLGCERLVRENGDWPIISGLTFMSGVRRSDTHVDYELDTPTWIGPWDAEADKPGYGTIKQVEELIKRSGLICEAYEDLRPVQWSKLIFNSAVNAIGAVTNTAHVPFYADTENLSDLGNLVHDMMAEGVAIANALGITLSSDPWAMNCKAVSQGGSHGTDEYAHITSMLDDVRNQTYTEVDWITGSIVRAAREAGVPAPHHETLYRLVKGIEKGWSLDESEH